MKGRIHQHKLFLTIAIIVYVGVSGALIAGYTVSRNDRLISSAAIGISNTVGLFMSEPAGQNRTQNREKLSSLLAVAGLDQILSCLVLSSPSLPEVSWPDYNCESYSDKRIDRITLRVGAEAISVKFSLSKTDYSEHLASDLVWLVGLVLVPLLVLGIPLLIFYRRAEDQATLTEKIRDYENLETELRTATSIAEESDSRTKETLQQFRDAVEAVPEGFVLFDQNDHFIWCNKKYRDLHHIIVDCLKPGVPFEEIIREGVKKGQYLDAIGQEEIWIQNRLRQHKNPTGTTEQKFVDGNWYRIDERVTEAGFTVGFRTEVTKLKQREFALLQSEEQLRQTINAALDCIITIDTEGRIIEFNPGAEETFGYSRDDVVGKLMHELIMPPKFRDAHKAGVSKYLNSGEGPVLGKRVEIEGMRADGSNFPAELAIQVAPQGSSEIFIGYLRDITERKISEEALRLEKEKAEIANSAKDHFLAMMSHEIRTPLNGVIGLLGMIQDTNLDDDQIELLEIARQSGESLLDLANDILDFSKMEADKLELESEIFEVQPLIDSVIDVLSPSAAKNNINIFSELDAVVPPLLIGDQGRIRQIILNLASNAVKFTEKGFVRLKTSGGYPDGDGKFNLLVEVEDTGIGIAKEKQGDLFREFTTVDPTYSRKFGGTGLGLAISRRLTSIMEGEIGLTSEEGRGSTFWFRIPVDVADAEGLEYHGQPAIISTPSTRPKFGRLRILVADDTPTNGLVARKMLEKLGFIVDTVLNGSEAIEAVKSRRYDLVFMDISMPEMDGLEATAAIRELPGQKGEVPIIALTAYAMKGDREDFIQRGMNGYLAKPIVQTQLIRVLDQWGNKRYSREEAPFERKEAASIQGETLVELGVLEELANQIKLTDLNLIVDSFINDTTELLSKIDKACEGNDFGALEAAAHAMRSSAATFGVIAMSASAGKIEDLCKSGQGDKAMELADGLSEHSEEVYSALRRFVAERQAP